MEEAIVKAIIIQGPLAAFMLLVIRSLKDTNQTLISTVQAIQDQRFKAMDSHIEKLEARSEKLEKKSELCEADRLRIQAEISELKGQRI